jgi:hypothetical protein
MNIFKSFKEKVFNIHSLDFEETSIELFKYQYTNNRIYRNYVQVLGKNPDLVKGIADIPFLPIDFFKNQDIITDKWTPDTFFESSGTTGMQPSVHQIRDIDFYLSLCENIFNKKFGPLSDYKILGLLPSYLERDHSSLIAMVHEFIEKAAKGSGFYLNNYEDLIKNLKVNDSEKVIIWGVTFAILDLAEKYPMDLSHVLIIETGGMKGRRRELTREEFYQVLKEKLNVNQVFAEYGMTELLSQAYAENGKFKSPDSMKVLVRDVNDPFSYVEKGKTGGLNIIDLANIHSCAFIETKDLGRIRDDDDFEVLGRFDNSDLRGCNLMLL